MVIFIPEKLKDVVESWLMRSDRTKEYGGVFYGTETEFKSFLPIPNFSQTPHKEFKFGNSSEYYIQEFGNIIGHSIRAEMHTHPNGTIPSEGDRKYIQHHSFPGVEIVIADMGNEFKWFGFDKDLKHVTLYFKDIELEKMVLSLSQSYGLMDLGRCMITPNNELLCDTEHGKQFLLFDSDTYTVWKWLKEHKDGWRTRTKTQLHKDTGLSLKKINLALYKLGTKL